MKRSTVAVTGAAGFIGSNLVRWLSARGYAVVGLDDLSLGRTSNLRLDDTLVVGNVSDPLVWRDVPPVDSIVHLAGASSTPMFTNDLTGSFSDSVSAFLRVLEVARIRNISRVIYSSTSLVYGNTGVIQSEQGTISPLNFYALSKLTMENIARLYEEQFGLECIGLRLMSVYGPRERHKGEMANLVSQFIWKVQSGRSPIVYGDGSQTRDFTSVWDVAQAIERIIAHPGRLEARILNIGTGVATSLNDLLDLLSRMMEVTVRPRYVPIPNATAYNQHQRASIEQVVARTGYQPRVSLERGIEEILGLIHVCEDRHPLTDDGQDQASLRP